MSEDTPRRFKVEHLSDFHYGEPARGSLMVLRLHPREDSGQRVAGFSLDIDPVTVPLAFADPFGNACHLFNIHRAHEHTTVHSQAEVVTAPAPPLPARMEENAWEALAAAAAPLDHWEFLAPSRFARSSPALVVFTDTNGLRRGADPLSSLLELGRALHALFRYEPGSTAVDSPIEHILETGRGVCQDYTHVMITIARSWASRAVTSRATCTGKARRASRHPRGRATPGPSSCSPISAGSASTRPTTLWPTTAMSASPWAATMPMRRRRGVRCSAAGSPVSTCG